MVFTPGRYIIIDDNEEELQKLVKALHKINAPCLPLYYDQAQGIGDAKMDGVRILFLDLHLLSGTGAAINVQASAAIIIEILERCISPTSGPYVIILWTSHAEQKDAFEAYLTEHLRVDVQPVAVLSLDKNLYLGGDAGDKLHSDVKEVVEADPRLRALLQWEREVLKAAGATMSEVGRLAAEGGKEAVKFSDRLDKVLSLLAVEAAGQTAAASDPFSAINAVLVPILSDRIANMRTKPETDDIWQKALTKTGEPNNLSSNEAARLNSLIHIAAASSEEMKSSMWGAVTTLSAEGFTAEFISEKLSIPSKELLSTIFCVSEKSDRIKSKLCLARVGASCDYAQNRSGPMPFVVGAIIPANASRRKAGIPDADFPTPTFLMADGTEVIACFNTRLQISLVPEDIVGWMPSFRIREQLLLQLTTHAATYSTRPAIVSFHQQAPEPAKAVEPEAPLPAEPA